VRPTQTPIGLLLAATAKTVSRGFSDALAAAGGTLPTWLVLSSLKGSPHPKQLELAHAIGIEGPTLTRHLDGLEAKGLVARRRDPDDRRSVHVELTEAGDRLFHELRLAAMAFDRRLREGFDEEELAALRASLAKLGANAGE